MTTAKPSRYRALVARIVLCGLLAGAVISDAARAETTSSRTTQSSNPYAAYIAEAAQRFGIPAHWVAAVMRAESAGHARAVSPKGAMGLMQIMPDTWDELRARYGLGRDPFDPRDNILAGAAYLNELHDRFGSPGFLAAYNAGPTRYAEYLATGRPLPRETRAYVAALAPLIGLPDAAEPQQQSAVMVVDWHTAPLFATHADRQNSADATRPTGGAGVYPPHTSGASDSLFPPNGTGDQQ
ncbi:lytic transglycosylase domain-containing protein [Psychromarinibacter sp. C21-152]|uniref:Lytic transglycosylase domain-containing protein n=1 Tax=Psychromarinibacter sediminicola TaxID=3033385 RepID=A0AAE3NVZ5_9RHOB|nr:lytic transglycosylase domain-containing protein [Psychromarinibacter sediminicola]MDF0601652.1 lytic transglycosylase domain-containing protein [Psychromarinibacter sediminicola]